MAHKRRQRVFVAMSGGVDSSVAAALLKERGFEVVGIHMKIWSDPEIPCTLREDRYDAMRVAAKLGVPFETWDFTDEYRRAVVEYMIREYAAGRTPNPDVMCNRRVKFGIFLERALEAGADYVATGHYVRLRDSINARNVILSASEGSPRDSSASPQNDETARYTLRTAKDTNKDQSYFLWTLTQEQLGRCLFPIGEYTKPEVREMAQRSGLPTAEKPDSQGICFIGEINVREFLERYIPERRGRVVTTAGRPIGEHRGVEFYTIGQRSGLGIGGGVPYYVAEKDLTTNTLVVSEGPDDERLYRRELVATGVNWITGSPPEFPLRCGARIRYRQPLQRCTVRIVENDEIDEIEIPTKRSDPPRSGRAGTIHRAKQSDDFIVTFDVPQRAVTPGQSVVFYRGKEVLGGGVINA